MKNVMSVLDSVLIIVKPSALFAHIIFSEDRSITYKNELALMRSLNYSKLCRCEVVHVSGIQIW